MKLSDNLSLAEVTKSVTALRNGIANTPTVTHLISLKEVAKNIFQPCRELFWNAISGYLRVSKRGFERFNRWVIKRSQHSKGEALDLDAQVYGGFTNRELFLYIKDHLVF